MARNPDRIQLEYDLVFDTLFHCGTGIRSGLIDRSVIKDNQEYLYVPGSTFKGVLREQCEQLARFFDVEGQDISSPHDAEAVLQELGKSRQTMISRIFGSHISPGLLFFNDARQSPDDLKQYDSASGHNSGRGAYKTMQVDIYTQARLARMTRTAVPGALYTSEFGTKDMVFKGTIQGWLNCLPIQGDFFSGSDPVPTYSLLLLLAGLRMFDRLGGNKSAGKGKCRCQMIGLEINGKQCSEATWISWLEHIEVLSDYAGVREE